jgi:hypothetical protein
MAKEAENSRRHEIPWRMIGWSIPVLLLLLPLLAMRFTDEVNWTASDFVFAGVLFGSVGLTFELIVRKSGSLAYRVGAALAVLAAFMTIWANGAVGMIGDEDNPLNLMFGGVLAIALFGAVLARFRPEGMARAMAAAAAAQFLASAYGAFTDLRGGILSAMFAGLWILSAALFAKAARDQRLSPNLNR